MGALVVYLVRMGRFAALVFLGLSACAAEPAFTTRQGVVVFVDGADPSHVDQSELELGLDLVAERIPAEAFSDALAGAQIWMRAEPITCAGDAAWACYHEGKEIEITVTERCLLASGLAHELAHLAQEGEDLALDHARPAFSWPWSWEAASVAGLLETPACAAWRR